MSDAEILELFAEFNDLNERAAVKERQAVIYQNLAQVETTDARNLRNRALVIAKQLGLTT